MSVTLYLSGNYKEDELCSDGTVFFSGQRSGRRDHLVSNSHPLYVFARHGVDGTYVLRGRYNVIKRERSSVTGLNVFKLQPHSDQGVLTLLNGRKFRTKNEICATFGWVPLNQFEATHGIILHKRPAEA